MSIDLHCTKCRKLIRAPDSAGGRHGKCPYCKERVYIPTPPDAIEPLDLAPVDEEAERRAEALGRESLDYVSAIGHSKGTVSDAKSSSDAGTPKATRQQTPQQSSNRTAQDTPNKTRQETTPIDIDHEVAAFVKAMHESRLEDAGAAADRLMSVKRRASKHVSRLLKDNTPTFGDVPAPLVQGFLKNLLSRLA